MSIGCMRLFAHRAACHQQPSHVYLLHSASAVLSDSVQQYTAGLLLRKLPKGSREAIRMQYFELQGFCNSCANFDEQEHGVCSCSPRQKVVHLQPLLLLSCLPLINEFVISQPCRSTQSPFHACCAAHLLDLLPFRVTGDCCAAPKAPTPPKSPGELAGAAPNRLLPLLAKLKGDAGAEAGAEPAKKPPYRLCPVMTGVLAACGAPSARAPNVAGAL